MTLFCPAQVEIKKKNINSPYKNTWLYIFEHIELERDRCQEHALTCLVTEG